MIKEDNIINGIRIFIMWCAAVVEYIFGGYDGIFVTFILFMAIDYITGVLCAGLNHSISSRIGAKGLAKKFGILCIIAVTSLMEKNIFNTSTLRNAIILFYISNEGISILENLSKLGIKIPQRLKNVLVDLCEKSEEK